MKTLVSHIARALVFVLVMVASTQVRANECPTFTHEQDVLIRKAHAIGDYHDLGYTLAAIVWKESIVGSYIVRINVSDGTMGSFGVGQVLLTTAMELTGETNTWRAKSHLAKHLINHDVDALRMSLAYLTKHDHLGYRNMIVKYNGAGPAARKYGLDVVSRVRTLQSCLILDA